MKKRVKTKIHTKSEKFYYLVIFLGIIGLLLINYVEIKLLITVLNVIFLSGSYIIYKEKINKDFIIAFLFALALTSYFVYEYTSSNLFIGRINLFALTSWTAGLVVLSEIYRRLNVKYRYIIICLIYVIILFILEYIGYYILRIRLNSNYLSLLNLGIIHGPWSLKIIYLTLGPIYLLTTNYLKIK